MSQETADLAIAAVRGQFTVVSVPDEETQRHWERMVSGGNVVGNEHHDAYLAAGMVSQGISQILTSNAKHFHFPHVTALAPDTVNRREYVSSWHPPSGHLSQNQRAPTLHADATQSRGLGGPMKSAPQAVSASQSQSTVAPARQPSPAEPPPAVKEAKHQERESSSLHAQRQRDEQTQKAAQAQARQAEAHSRGGRSR
jgi:hypothetical protein